MTLSALSPVRALLVRGLCVVLVLLATGLSGAVTAGPLDAIGATAGSPESRARAAGELGATLLEAHRYREAGVPLRAAYEGIPDSAERARVALLLGHLARATRQPDEARGWYQVARNMAGATEETVLLAQTHLVDFLPADARWPALVEVSQRLASHTNDSAWARHHRVLGQFARAAGEQAAPLAFHHLDLARSLAQAGRDGRELAEVLLALAQRYEDQRRFEEALALVRQSAAVADEAGTSALDRRVRLEWHLGRLNQALGRDAAALAAYQRAVELVSAAGDELPIETEDGESSYSAFIEPVFVAYIDLLLREADRQPEALRARTLRRALEAIESIRHTELQDFMGDRCAVATARDALGVLPADAAVLYPVMLPERLELLVETAQGIVRRTVPVSRKQVTNWSGNLAEALRNGSPAFLSDSQALHRVLIAPVAAVLHEQSVRTLVVIPDGALRLIPFAALHDGSAFLVEHLAVSMATGLSLVSDGKPVGASAASLVAGVAVPGPVVEKMLQRQTSSVAAETGESRGGPAVSRTTRALRGPAEGTGRGDDPERVRRNVEQYRDALSLPGVRDEVGTLTHLLGAQSLLDSGFTVGAFQHEAGQGGYRIVHIASHGVFGGSAEASFIMAYDDVLSMNGFETLLRSERVQQRPIEMLTLSACQTAEGSDRAPLGFAGVAIKARARSVLGTLWPVDDGAAKQLMAAFYSGLVKSERSKAEALRQAQLALLRTEASAHPFFWAPFVLIGNWR